MGWWKSEHGIIGDRVADIMDHALDSIERVYREKADRPPMQGELSDLIEFCTRGILVPSCGSTATPFTDVGGAMDTAPRVQPSGRQGVLGPFAACREGELVNVDPRTMLHYEAGEIQQVMEESEKEAKEAGQQFYFSNRDFSPRGSSEADFSEGEFPRDDDTEVLE